jgi:hypothetical protein
MTSDGRHSSVLTGFVAAAALLAACGGGSTPVDPATPTLAQECSGSCAGAASFLSVSDVQRVLAQAVAEAQARNARATIAVVDRVGNVLAVYRMAGAANMMTITRRTAAGAPSRAVSKTSTSCPRVSALSPRRSPAHICRVRGMRSVRVPPVR